MPDLGAYAAYVLSAYGVTFALIFGLIAVSLRRSARVRAELEALETTRKGAAHDG